MALKRSTKETHSGQGWSSREGRVSAAAAEEEEERRRNCGGVKEIGLNKRKEEVTVTGAVRWVRKSAVPIPYIASLEIDIVLFSFLLSVTAEVYLNGWNTVAGF